MRECHRCHGLCKYGLVTSKVRKLIVVATYQDHIIRLFLYTVITIINDASSPPLLLSYLLTVTSLVHLIARYWTNVVSWLKTLHGFTIHLISC